MISSLVEEFPHDVREVIEAAAKIEMTDRVLILLDIVNFLLFSKNLILIFVIRRKRAVVY